MGHIIVVLPSGDDVTCFSFKTIYMYIYISMVDGDRCLQVTRRVSCHSFLSVRSSTFLGPGRDVSSKFILWTPTLSSDKPSNVQATGTSQLRYVCTGGNRKRPETVTPEDHHASSCPVLYPFSLQFFMQRGILVREFTLSGLYPLLSSPLQSPDSLKELFQTGLSRRCRRDGGGRGNPVWSETGESGRRKDRRRDCLCGSNQVDVSGRFVYGWGPSGLEVYRGERVGVHMEQG